MNVEIGAEAALFPEKEYINGIAVAVHVTHSTCIVHSNQDIFLPCHTDILLSIRNTVHAPKVQYRLSLAWTYKSTGSQPFSSYCCSGNNMQYITYWIKCSWELPSNLFTMYIRLLLQSHTYYCTYPIKTVPGSCSRPRCGDGRNIASKPVDDLLAVECSSKDASKQ